MNINEVLDQIHRHPKILEAGMVLVHMGQVRMTDLKGRKVKSLDVQHDEAKAETLRQEMLQRPGIVEIIIQLNSGHLLPGDPVMIAAVAGDIRDHVFPVLRELVDRLKKEGSRKSEELA